MENKKLIPYKKCTWLNSEMSPSTGSVVAFDGEMLFRGVMERNTFLSISDCNGTIRLHPVEGESIGVFIEKLNRLNESIDLFIKHLENYAE